MTMDVFGFEKKHFIDGISYADAAVFLDFAIAADIQLFVWGERGVNHELFGD